MSKKRMLALACITLLATSANADTICRLTLAPGLAFGPYDVMSTLPRDTQADIRVRCERNAGPGQVNVTIGLSAGANSASPAARRLRAPAGPIPLTYAIFRDSGRSLVWGPTPGLDAYGQSVNVPNKSFMDLTFTMYGRIPAQQDVTAGTYADTITATLLP